MDYGHEVAELAKLYQSQPKSSGAKLPKQYAPLETDPEYAAEIISRLFEQFEKNYGTYRWTQQWPDHKGAMREWTYRLRNESAASIAWGLEKLFEDPDDWPPSANHFHAICRCFVPPLEHRHRPTVASLAHDQTGDSKVARKHRSIMRGMLEMGDEKDAAAYARYERKEWPTARKALLGRLGIKDGPGVPS